MDDDRFIRNVSFFQSVSARLVLYCLFMNFLFSSSAQAHSIIDGHYQQHDCLDCRVDFEPIWVSNQQICFRSARHCFPIDNVNKARWHFTGAWQIEDGYRHQSIEVMVVGQITGDSMLTFSVTHFSPVAETLSSHWVHGLARYQRESFTPP